MKFLEYIEIVREMDLPLGEYAILGSGPLAIRGIRDSKDIDLIVTPEIYSYYRKQDDWKLRFAYGNFFLRNDPVEMWKKIGFWRDLINIRDFIDGAELIGDLPYVNLDDFILWKELAMRPKDKRDVELAREWMREHSN